MMTKQDFQGLADTVAEINSATGCDPYWLANRLAEWCATKNPRFDAERFLVACGVEVNR